ncbi:MAG: A24 family peptidase [Candidatus Woesearchaeota archaeon]
MEIFLLIIAFVWLIIATVTDIKTKEIPNWINYSLIIVALVTYSLISIKSNSITPILFSIITGAAFFILGSLMYYAKQWGGGDAKLLAAIGTTFPIYPTILENIFTPKFQAPYFPITILINIIIVGALYGITILIIKILQNRKKFSEEFKKVNSKFKRLRNIALPVSILLIVLGYFLSSTYQLKVLTISSGILILILFYLYLTIKAAEKTSMFKKIPVEKLREGDWISKEIKIDDKIIYKPKAAGVSKEEIEEIKKHFKEIEIKDGIVFMPTFLIAIITSLILGNPILWLF